MPNVPYYRANPVTPPSNSKPVHSSSRIRILYTILLCLTTVFIIRLFYLQVIRHDYYKKAALRSQLKEYEIPAERGVIYAHDGEAVTPLVLNEKKYTLFADPVYVKDSLKVASELAKVIGGDVNKVREQLETKNTRYVVLAKKLSKDQSSAIDTLDFNGVGTREEVYRTYPQGSLASQVIGFVNDSGEGQYGIEEFFDGRLAGNPGQLKAITDVRGVPLVSNKDNIVTDPKPGDQIQLTIDVGLQRQLEDILKAGLDRAKSNSGSALILDAETGAVKAMGNYPSFDPSNLKDISDLSTLGNPEVSSQLEVGSIMKPLTAAAAINEGVVQRDTTYYDPARIVIGDRVVTNVEEDGGPGTKSIGDFLRLSLNTGAVYLLQRLGGGEINEKGRKIWHDYMTNHYGFGAPTGIELTSEAKGTVPSPTEGYGLDITYANTSFGQGMSATLMQMASAYASIVNGGSYVKPHVVESITNADGSKTVTPRSVVRQAVSEKTSADARWLLEYVFTQNHGIYGMPNLPTGYSIGGKTGTAQIAKPEGGYYTDRYTGTFAGFVGGDKPQYIIVVRVNEPKIGGFAGAQATAPVFSNLATMMIQNYGVKPKQ